MNRAVFKAASLLLVLVCFAISVSCSDSSLDLTGVEANGYKVARGRSFSYQTQSRKTYISNVTIDSYLSRAISVPVEIGGDTYDMLPGEGSTIAATPDGSMMFLSRNLPSPLVVFFNPMLGGDRAPDFTLSSDGSGGVLKAGIIFYDHIQDCLYVQDGNFGSGNELRVFYAWDNASELTADRAPDRVFRILDPDAQSSYFRIEGFTVCPETDDLVVVTDDPAYAIIENASTLTGDITPANVVDYYWSIINLSRASLVLHCAYDGPDDILYIDHTGGDMRLLKFDGASARTGMQQITPIVLDVFTNYCSGLRLDMANDRLFYACSNGSLLLYDEVSAITASPTYSHRFDLTDDMRSFGIWFEEE